MMTHKPVKIQRLRAVRLDVKSFPNVEKPMKQLKEGAIYIVLGEVSNSDHYILLELESGHILPGMWHMDRFEEVSRDDI
jgi:hypothetical protein